MNKKIGILALVLVLIGFLGIMLHYSGLFYSTFPFEEGDIITLEDGMAIADEICGRFNPVTVIYKTGCIECQKVMPILKKIEEENNLNFTYYDMLNPEDMVKLSELKLTLKKAPIAIIDCKVYDSRSELEYKNYILGETRI